MITLGASNINTLDQIYPLIPEKDLGRLAKLFCREQVMALTNQKSSLPMILNPIAKITPSNGFGVTVAIGGTNGYVSAFRIYKGKKIKFLNRKIFALPVYTSKEKLFRLIAENIFQVTKNKKKDFPIGIGLAYPLKPMLINNILDGELLSVTKGRQIEGLVGKKVGQEFHKFLIKEYGVDTTVVVANDAICLLLGGDGTEVVGIVGTGLNFAYWQKRFAIAPLKLGELSGFGQGEVAVNIESGDFDQVEGTKLRKVIDQKSDDPGRSLAEKETAGAYLYQIFNAGKEEILSKNFPDLSSTDQLNDILTRAYNYPTNIDKAIKDKAYLFTERIFHRSAQIVAIELCGILFKISKTRGIVPIVMEGGVFWKAKNYPSLVNLYINMILPEIIPSFARLFGSSRRGIAILAKSTY